MMVASCRILRASTSGRACTAPYKLRARPAPRTSRLTSRSSLADRYKAHGIVVTEEEEKACVRKVMRLLYEGDDVENKAAAAIESGLVDQKMLAVMYEKLRAVSLGEEAEGDELMLGVQGSTLQALSVLYSQLEYEFRKRAVSPAMKLLDQALDIMLDAGRGDETERLLQVRALLSESFLGAGLGTDPLSAAAYFAMAERDETVRKDIDAYLGSRIPASQFLAEVEARLVAIRGEFEQMDEQDRVRAAEADAVGRTDWLESVREQNELAARKAQRERILKYTEYIVELAEGI